MAYDFYLPVRVGDTIVVSPKVADIALKEGKTKMMGSSDSRQVIPTRTVILSPNRTKP